MHLPQIFLCCSSSRWLDLDRVQIVLDHDLQIHKLNALNRSRTNNMEDESWKKHQPKFEKPNLQTLERTRHFTDFTPSRDRFFLLPGSLWDLKVWEVSTAEGAWMRGSIKLPSKSCSSVRVKSTNFDVFKPRSDNNCSTSIGKGSSKRGSKGEEEQRTGEEQKNENRRKNQENRTKQ